jgi:hypothetical protein
MHYVLHRSLPPPHPLPDFQVQDTPSVDNAQAKEVIKRLNHIIGVLVWRGDFSCPICLDIVTNRHFHITKCEHIFHDYCMLELLKLPEKICPTCRTAL